MVKEPKEETLETKIKKLQQELKEELIIRNERSKEVKLLKDQIHELSKGMVLRQPFSGSRMKIGVISDTHKGSLYANQHLENALINTFNKEGVDAVYHIGDMVDGEKMYTGHEYEIKIHGADAQMKHAIKTFPHVESKMYLISGNHDQAYWKKTGFDICAAIARERDDFEYLGRDQAIIEIRPGVRLALVHPGGGTAYAVSYKSQKLIESFSGGDKPNILLIGHFHKYDHLFYRNIQAFQCPTTCSQTPYMKRKPTPAIMGGLILDITMNKKGISKLKTEYLPYYEPNGK